MPIQCNCPSKILLNKGCQCGSLKQGQTLNNSSGYCNKIDENIFIKGFIQNTKKAKKNC